MTALLALGVFLVSIGALGYAYERGKDHGRREERLRQRYADFVSESRKRPPTGGTGTVRPQRVM